MKAIDLVIVLLAALGTGCPPPNPGPVPPDADAAPAPITDAAPTTPCAAACANLVLQGCPEGQPADCVTVLAHIESQRLVAGAGGVPLTCMAVATATSVAAVRATGVACGAKP